MGPWKSGRHDVQDEPGLLCNDQSAKRLSQAAVVKGLPRAREAVSDQQWAD